MKTTKEYGETRCVICQNGLKSLRRILWTRVSQNTETHPRVLLVNYLQSRKEKWCRVSTVFIITSRRTEIATFTSEPKLQRLPCRKRTGTVVPRAENFGDLITADHKVLGEGCESRHNHRNAVVFHNHTRGKQKLLRQRTKCLRKFLEQTRKPKVIYTVSSQVFVCCVHRMAPVDCRPIIKCGKIWLYRIVSALCGGKWIQSWEEASYVQSLWEDFPAPERHTVRLFPRQE